MLAEFVEGLLVLKPDALEGHPKISKLHAQIVAMPSVKAYLTSERRFPFPAEGEVCDDYVANVRTVLYNK